MKVPKLIMSILLQTCLVPCHAECMLCDYYWYKGKQTEVPVNRENLLLYYQNSTSTEARLQQTYGIKPVDIAFQDSDYDKDVYYTIFTVDSTQYDFVFQSLMAEENILSVQRCYGDNLPTPTGRHFYVNLKSPEDISLLEGVSSQTNTRISRKMPLGNWYSVETSTESAGDALACSNIFYETGLFESVDPGFFMNIEPQAYLTDSNFGTQWYLSDSINGINVNNAWDYTTGSPNIKVAFFDSGIRKDHVEFIHTTYLDTYNSYRDTHNDELFTDHGTKVAGIVAANHNYGEIAGIVPNCSFYDICAPTESVSSTNSFQRREVTPENMIRGFRFAIDNGVDVINCS